jgi:hypothetical protein
MIIIITSIIITIITIIIITIILLTIIIIITIILLISPLQVVGAVLQGMEGIYSEINMVNI